MVANVALHSPAQLNSPLHVTICDSVATPYPPLTGQRCRAFQGFRDRKTSARFCLTSGPIFEPSFNQPNCRSLSYSSTLITHRHPGILHSRVQIDGVDCFRHNLKESSPAASRYVCPHLASSVVVIQP